LSPRFQAQTGCHSVLAAIIEKEGERFFLQPVVLEYVTDQFVQWSLRNCYPNARATQNPCLIKAQAKDYVREMKRLIVEPIAEQLRIQFGNPQALSCS